MKFSSAVLSFLALYVFVLVTGCQYYEDFRVKKATADLRDEQAELLHAYRMCLQRYEANPPQAREHCAPYTQSLREIDVRRDAAHY